MISWFESVAEQWAPFQSVVSIAVFLNVDTTVGLRKVTGFCYNSSEVGLT